MTFTAVSGVQSYDVTDSGAIFDCELDRTADDNGSIGRTVPVTLEFLRPDSFRFRLDVNPEGSTASSQHDAQGFARDVDVSVTESPDSVVLETAVLEVEIGLDEWRFDVTDSTGSIRLSEHRSRIGPRGVDEITPLGFCEAAPDDSAVAVTEVGTSFSLQHDDHLYGLGETFTAFDKRGQSVESWTVAAQGTETKRSYKNVPFFLSTRGYGLLVETTQRVEFDVGDSSTGAVSIDVDGDKFSFVYFDGPSFEQILRGFTAYTGRSPRPPKWSFGLWMSRAGYETREEVEAVAAQLRDEAIPCDVLHLDPQWMGVDDAIELAWDTDRFPEPASMLESLHDDGFRVSLWEHPYVPVETDSFETAAESGFLVEDPGGDPYVLDNLVLGQFRGGIVDFTNPDATAWWQAQHQSLLEMGVDAFKTDFGEDVPEDGVFADGRTGTVVHNEYPNLYNEAVHDAIADANGASEAVTWGRSAWTGGQRYPLYWGGDPDASFEGLASALRGGLSLSLSGFPFWSHDVGGFWGEPSERLYIRWAQFGLLSSHVRCHGVTPREPWAFGDRATRIFKKFARLRYRLLPYLYSMAEIASQTGLPVVRPLVLHYQDDPAVYGLDDQYLLGRDLLVAPVLRADDTADVYLPDGEWVDIWSGDRYRGPQTLHRTVPLDSMPVFRRAESIVPMGEAAQTVASQSDTLSLRITMASSGASRAEAEVFDADADKLRTVSVSCDAERTRLECTIPAFDEYRIRTIVDGLSERLAEVVVNNERLPAVEPDSDEQGWMYHRNSGTVRISP